EIRAVYLRGVHQPVYEWGNVPGREAEDDAAANGVEAVIVSVRANVVGVPARITPLVLAKLSLDADILVKVVGSAEQATHVYRVVVRRHGRAIDRSIHRTLGCQIAVSEEDVPTRWGRFRRTFSGRCRLGRRSHRHCCHT